ncbi:MAG: hypothetical protein WC855_13320 [Thermodesulfovibrionales bacterium]
MAKKKTVEKQGVEKPLKKIRSFNIGDKVYNGVMELLGSSGTQITLSSLVDDFLRKLYVYLIEMEGVMEKKGSDMPFSHVIQDCMSVEYFREIKRNIRISNLILSHEASKAGLSVKDYMETLPYEALAEIEDQQDEK